MMSTLIVLAALGIGPPGAYPGVVDLIGFQGPSYSWTYSDPDTVFGFGSSDLGDWSYGEIRTRRAFTEIVAPQLAPQIIERERIRYVPLPRPLWRKMMRRGLIRY